MLPAILLDAKTLLTETITIAAIAANINFFIVEPANHSHNLCAKKKREFFLVDYQVFIIYAPKVDGVENEESMWKHSTKSWGM